MFKCPGARKQVQGQVLFKNKNKVKVRVLVKVFVSEKVFCYDSGIWLNIPFKSK